MKKIFITGTDTGVGKTHVTEKLLKKYQALGYRVLGLKPIASGCFKNHHGELKNDDALKLQAASSIQLPYAMINPWAFEPAIAPHIAAELIGAPLTKKTILLELNNLFNFLENSIQPPLDFVFIEGAGGWHLPLNYSELMSEVITELKIPVVLVIAMKLGCLNHGLLTYQAIQNSGAEFLGWIPNHWGEEMPYLNQNIETLESLLGSSGSVVQVESSTRDEHEVRPTIILGNGNPKLKFLK